MQLGLQTGATSGFSILEYDFEQQDFHEGRKIWQ